MLLLAAVLALITPASAQVEGTPQYDIVIRDGHVLDVGWTLQRPWTSIGSDAGAALQSGTAYVLRLPHPLSYYGTFPLILGRYVRDEGTLSLEEAIRKMTSWPAMMGSKTVGIGVALLTNGNQVHPHLVRISNLALDLLAEALKGRS